MHLPGATHDDAPVDADPYRIGDRLRTLTAEVESHHVFGHPFYELWMSFELEPGQLAIVARNYDARVGRTSDRLAMAFLLLDHVAIRADVVANLFDELGHGDPDRAHTVLLDRFWAELLSRLPGEVDIAETGLLPATVALLDGSRELFGGSDPATACGAILAQEWHAYHQIVCMYEGARQYQRHFSLHEFHEACEYFYLHLGEAEPEHKRQTLRMAEAVATDADSFAALEAGCRRYLDLLGDYWDEIYAAVGGGSRLTAVAVGANWPA